MTVTAAENAIAILIDLAQQGEIDPWDVDVIKVIDRFLSELGLIDDPESVNADLAQSGQAFVWASMLLLLKADTLDLLQAEVSDEDNLDLEEIDLLNEEARTSFPRNLENRIRRRAVAPPAQRRRVTLQELIEQIQHIAGEWEKTPVVNPPKDRVRSLKDAKSAIAKLAHDENLTEIATQLEHFLNFNLVQLTCRNYEVDFDNLVNCWTSEAGDGLEPLPQKNTHNRVALFWALLLLSAQSKVELSQEEFYQDLKIKPLIIDINKNTLDKVEENFS